LSAVVLNIVVGLLTSVISGAVVWAWGRARVARRQRERARFFGVSPADTCRIVAPQAFGSPRTVAKQDVFSIVELAKLMRDLRADLDVVGSGEGTHGVGDLTEFCVGGPTANVRMQSHLTRFLPGVSIRSAPPDSPDPGMIIAGGQEFRRERDSREYVLVAKVGPPGGGHPLFLICGQTAITNRAAASYLRERYREISSAHGAGGNWCIVLRVVAPSIYGHQMTELAADVSASTFSVLTSAGDPGGGHA
jgi:hypothetical protein